MTSLFSWSRRTWVFALLGTTLGLGALSTQAMRIARPPTDVRPPVLPPQRLVQSNDASNPIILKNVRVTTKGTGTLVTTEVELRLSNPNQRQLEGLLQIPMREGQNITSFALESLDGQSMLPAVPVPKNKGQVVFESIERRQADPALLEQTAENNFKLRVYPILPGKTRAVRLQWTEQLTTSPQGSVRWALPSFLHSLPPEATLDLDVQIAGIKTHQLVLSPELQRLPAWRSVQNQDTAQKENRVDAIKSWGTNWRQGTVSWPVLRTSANIWTDRWEANDYFYADIPLPSAALAKRPLPSELTLMWDASGSGAQRDHEREKAFLQTLFQTVPDVRVRLIVARDVAEPSQTFVVQQGNWTALKSALDTVVYDGATSIVSMTPPADSTFSLIMTDGMFNWGESKTPSCAATCYTISATPRLNAALLQRWAEASNSGRYINLMNVKASEAVDQVLTVQPQILIESTQGISDIERRSMYAQQGRVQFAGRLTQSSGQLDVVMKDAQGREQYRTPLSIHSSSTPSPLTAPSLAALQWASYRLHRLEAQPRLYQAEIDRIGSQFRLPTSQTSLLILESLDDYIRYDIQPPAGPWRDEYEKKAQLKQKDEAAQRTQQLGRLNERFQDYQQWWEKDFPKDIPNLGKKKGAVVEEGSRGALSVNAAPPPAPAAVAAPARALARAPSPLADESAAMQAESAERQGSAAPGMTQATIQLQALASNERYALRLREAKADERYQIYLDERPSHLQSPAFFLDVADVFFDHQQTDLALRILSNLAEMDLDNRQLQRVLAYRLIQAQRYELAEPLLQQVTRLAPEEPQSWRDLGLLYERMGRPQDAVDQLWKVASQPWDGRFADIDLMALVELNGVIARAKNKVNVSQLDPRLLRAMPLDLRTVLTWDADNTDMDLHVIDPNGEEVFYSHPLSYQGGMLSRDFVGGYGPEAFSLKKAKPGTYQVRVHFYGQRQQAVIPYTTLMLRLTTGFSTDAQKEQNVVLRLKEQGGTVMVGTFEVN